MALQLAQESATTAHYKGRRMAEAGAAKVGGGTKILQADLRVGLQPDSCLLT